MCMITNIDYYNDELRWIGFRITMSDTEKNINCKISNSQQCCEKFGVSTNKDFTHFIGAEYFGIDIGNIEKDEDSYEMSKISLHIYTDKGVFTITFYNQHNGYYSHDVFISNEGNIGFHISI